VAKAQDIQGLVPTMTFAQAAAATVTVRSQEMFAHAGGVLDTEDIERVHAMRVATRRLRAVLEFYAPCFPKAPFKSVLRDVKALADALGARRDPDVQLAALDAFAAAAAPEDRPGVEVLAARVRADQELGNAELAAALARAQDTDLRGRLARLTGSTR
jgi:CHAD domain-containing protein